MSEEPALNPDSDEEYLPENDEDEEEEERKSVNTITAALNIKVDMYKEMKKRRKKREVSNSMYM